MNTFSRITNTLFILMTCTVLNQIQASHAHQSSLQKNYKLLNLCRGNQRHLWRILDYKPILKHSADGRYVLADLKIEQDVTLTQQTLLADIIELKKIMGKHEIHPFQNQLINSEREYGKYRKDLVYSNKQAHKLLAYFKGREFNWNNLEAVMDEFHFGIVGIIREDGTVKMDTISFYK